MDEIIRILAAANSASPRLLLWLLNVCWQAGILIGIIWLGLRTFRIKTAPIRFYLWLFALLGVALLPVISPSLPHLKPLWVLQRPPEEPPMELVEFQPPLVSEITSEVGDYEPTPVEERVEFKPPEPIEIMPTKESPWPKIKEYWPLSLAGAWILGTVFFLARLLRGHLAIRRLKRNAREIKSASVLESASETAARIGLKRNVRLLASSDVSQPATAGIFRPAVILPDEFIKSAGADEIRPILIHEFAHIRRRDFLINLFQRLLEAAFFFHPLIWIASRNLRLTREEICDNWVLEITGEGKSYARSLAKFAEAISVRRLPATVALIHRRPEILRRIEMILDEKRKIATRLSKKAALLILLTFAFSLPLISAFPFVGEAPAVAQAEEVEKAPEPAAAEEPKIRGLEWIEWIKETAPIPDEAIEALLAKHPDDAEIHLGAAFILKQEENKAEATNKALKLAPEYKKILLIQDLKPVQLKEFALEEEAFIRLEELIRIDPGNGWPHYILAGHYLKKGEKEKWLAQVDAAISKPRLDDYEPERQRAIFRVLDEISPPFKAVWKKYYHAAILFPELGSARDAAQELVKIGKEFEEKGERERALEYYKKAEHIGQQLLLKKPDLLVTRWVSNTIKKTAYQEMARFYEQEGREEEAASLRQKMGFFDTWEKDFKKTASKNEIIIRPIFDAQPGRRFEKIAREFLNSPGYTKMVDTFLDKFWSEGEISANKSLPEEKESPTARYIEGVEKEKEELARAIDQATLPSGEYRRVCRSSLKQIGLACLMYASDYNGVFPPSFEVLRKRGYIHKKAIPKLMKCPASGEEYVYIGAGKSQKTAKRPDITIIAYDKEPVHDSGRNAIFMDGHVEWMTEEKFQELMSKQAVEKKSERPDRYEAVEVTDRVVKEKGKPVVRLVAIGNLKTGKTVDANGNEIDAAAIGLKVPRAGELDNSLVVWLDIPGGDRKSIVSHWLADPESGKRLDGGGSTWRDIYKTADGSTVCRATTKMKMPPASWWPLQLRARVATGNWQVVGRPILVAAYQQLVSTHEMPYPLSPLEAIAVPGLNQADDDVRLSLMVPKSAWRQWVFWARGQRKDGQMIEPTAWNPGTEVVPLLSFRFERTKLSELELILVERRRWHEVTLNIPKILDLTETPTERGDEPLDIGTLELRPYEPLKAAETLQAEPQPKAAVKLEEILKGIELRQAKIKSGRIELVESAIFNGEKHDYEHFSRYIFSGDKRFCEVREKERDRERLYKLLFDGEKTTLISSGSGYDYPQVDIWPYKHMEIASNAPWLVHSWPDTFEGFKKRGLLSLVKETDLDGEPCYLLEGKGDNSPWRFWISKDKDFALLRWDVIHEGVLKIRWQMSDFRQVNGIWLAHMIIDRRPPKREEEGKIVTEEYITEVEEAAFNIPIPEETFKIEIEEGSLIKEHSPDDPKEIVKTYRFHGPATEKELEKPLSPEDAAVKKKLQQLVTFDLTAGVPFGDVIYLLQILGDIKIVVDSSVVSPEDMRYPITARLTDVTIETALKYILGQMGLRYVIKDGALFISDKLGVMEEPIQAVYDISDLLRIEDFEAPKLGIVEPGEEEKPLVLSEEERKKKTDEEGEKLAKLIQGEIDPEVWLAKANSIRYRDGQLIIRAPAPIQIKIQEFLENLRQERALVVQFDFRLVQAAPEFLEEIKKELELELAPIGGVVSPPAEDIPIPSNIREDELKALLKRVQESEKAKIMTAPRITLFNSQRGYFAQFDEDDYIFDIRPIKLAEGEIEKIEEVKKKVRTGLVFDVRPTISADRKYVQMDMYFGFAQITDFQKVKIQSGPTIEIPMLGVTEIKTTLKVPDGETLLITHLQMPAKEGEEEEEALTELLVLVTPHIIIQVEEERVLKEEE